MKKKRINVKISFKMELPKGMCVEEVTKYLKEHISTGNYWIKSYEVVDDEEKL